MTRELVRALRRSARGPAILGTIATVLTLFALRPLADQATLILNMYAASLGLLALRVATVAVAAVRPASGELRLEPWLASFREAPRTLGELESIERMLGFAEWSSFEGMRVRSELRRIATQRLASHRNIDIAAEPDRARAALGPGVWAALTTAEDRTASGVPVAGLREVITVLESI